MEHIDFNIALDIACRVGADSFTDLVGMLSTSKFFRSLAYNGTVLRQVSLKPFLDNSALINLSSTFRPFFGLCLEAQNPTACYLKALRLACREGCAEDGLALLLTIPSSSLHAQFATALLEVCLGKYHDAMHISAAFLEASSSFEAADAIATTVFHQMIHIGPRRIRSHCNTWHFEVYPSCPLTGCQMHNRCTDCLLYWYSVMFLVLC